MALMTFSETTVPELHTLGGDRDRASARGVCFWYQAVQVARAAASCRYRIGHFVELTRGADVVIGERLPTGVARRAHTLVCIRPFVTPSLEKTLLELQRAGVRLVADYDDLLFAGDISGLPSSATGSGSPAEKQRRLAAYSAGLRVFDRFLVSTRALARRLALLAPAARVTVVPNGLSSSWVEQGRALYPTFEPADPPTIRYFSGSPSHDHDFASILEPLRELLLRQTEVRLELVGHLKLDTTRLPAARVRQLPTVDYDRLPQLLASSWLNLAPLVPSEFTKCKSAIKFLEAAAFGCPSLASPSDDMLRHRELGGPVVICETAQDWSRELQASLDLARRNALSADGFRHVSAHGMAGANLSSWLDGLETRAAS
jgi:glycosyltransferase involved in cell wall biosynthesis